MMKESEILRLILSNNFICPVSNPDVFKYIDSDSRVFDRLKSYLSPFDIEFTKLKDIDVYVGLNISPNEVDKRAVVKQFEDVFHNIEPIIEMIACLAAADQDGSVLSMGESLTLAELTLIANENKHFESMLNEIAILLGVTKKANDEKIEALLERLRRHGLVRLIDSSKKVYRVTGKIDYIYSINNYILENHLGMVIDEELEQQQGLEL